MIFLLEGNNSFRMMDLMSIPNRPNPILLRALRCPNAKPPIHHMFKCLCRAAHKRKKKMTYRITVHKESLIILRKN